jgi:hypothetical protein
MQSEFYPWQSDDNRLYFEFLSVGPEKIIPKAVLFSPFQHLTNRFNLALADIKEDGSLCDIAVSNNHDLDKVMATVANCIATFFKHYPTAEIYIQGNTPSRTRLYQIIFSRELSIVTQNYEIYGTIGLVTEPFQPNRNYSSFLLKRKS